MWITIADNILFLHKHNALPTQESIFKNQASKKAADQQHRLKINYNIKQYDNAVLKGKKQFEHIELAKKRAKNIKWKSIENLGRYLEEFETNFIGNGGKVIWAEDAKEAVDEIIHILKTSDAKKVVKSKSMATEEIELNHHLEENGIEVAETDLGEYIVQLAGEKPYHIVTPAMHKSKEDVQLLFHNKLGTAPDLTPEQLTAVARDNLRQQYIDADIGITGANFLIANTGSIALTENEGNARLSTAYPKIHIVVAGIEKIIPKLEDLALYWPLLSSYGTGQDLTVYNSIISGPKKDNETDGPEEMYIILLDNGRTNLLAKPDQRESLFCIKCGACLNACPVYKNIGGHSYNTTYSGPIGAVTTPHLKDLKEYGHLSEASSLCGKCTEVCPVNIDLHNMLQYNRRDLAEVNGKSTTEKIKWTLWKKAMLNRKHMNRGTGVKNMFLSLFFGGTWGKKKELPKVQKSFNQQWIERFGKDPKKAKK